MNDTPPPDDAADDLEALYRRSSAQDPSRPSAKTRQAILEHSTRVATNRSLTPRSRWSVQSASSRALGRIAIVTGLSRPKWQRPVLVGSLAAAALAGLLIGPQYLRPTALPMTIQIPPRSTVSELKQPEPSRPSVVNLPATAPAPHFQVPARLAAPRADTTQSATTARAASGASNQSVTGGISAASSDASEQVSVTGARIRRAPGAPTAAAAAAAAASPIDARDIDGRTALMLAVLQGRLDAVTDLLRRGADPNAADNSGVTPLQAARANNRPEIADVLAHAGAR